LSEIQYQRSIRDPKKKKGQEDRGYQWLTQGTSEVILNIRQLKRLVQAVDEKALFTNLGLNILQKRQRPSHETLPAI
jgi:hypothetical protein